MEKAITLVDLIEKLWPMIAGIFAQFAWIIRLEAKVMYLEKEFKSHKQETNEKHEKHYEALWAKLNTMEANITALLSAVSKLEGKLENK